MTRAWDKVKVPDSNRTHHLTNIGRALNPLRELMECKDVELSPIIFIVIIIIIHHLDHHHHQAIHDAI